jgi:hypothetical protein
MVIQNLNLVILMIIDQMATYFGNTYLILQAQGRRRGIEVSCISLKISDKVESAVIRPLFPSLDKESA